MQPCICYINTVVGYTINLTSYADFCTFWQYAQLSIFN